MTCLHETYDPLPYRISVWRNNKVIYETPPVIVSGSPESHGDNFQPYDPRMIMAWNDWVVPLQKNEDGSYPTPQEMLPLWNAFQAEWRAKGEGK